MERIRGFDGLRALSVLFVIFTHAGIYAVWQSKGWLSESALPIISGAMGVQVFFVLSGYLITSLLMREQATTGTVSLKNFYIRRGFRILPLYVLCVVLTLLVDLFVWPVASEEAFWFAATFSTSFIPRDLYASILGHTWSLSVEEHFYLIWPAALLLVYRFTYNRALRHLLIAIAVSLICQSLLYQNAPALRAEFFLSRWSIFAGSWIAMGCAAAIVMNSPGYGRIKTFLGSRAALAIAAMLILHSIAITVKPGLLGEFFRVTGAMLLVCWLVRNQTSAVAQALEYRPLAYIGKISYGLYMWQGFILTTGPDRAQGQLWPLNAGLGIALLALVAPLSYHLFEARFLRLSKRFRHTAPSDPSEPAQTAPLAFGRS